MKNSQGMNTRSDITSDNFIFYDRFKCFSCGFQVIQKYQNEYPGHTKKTMEGKFYCESTIFL